MPNRFFAGQTNFIEELNALDGESGTAQAAIDAHIADTTGAHAASAISNTPAGNIAATTVQGAINELDTEKLSASATTLPSSFVNASLNSITPTGGTLSVNGAISANGNLVIGTAGNGIDFSADPSTAGMTSKLFDDYEEGTFTATITPETSGTITLSGSVDRMKYTKVGRLVTVTGRVTVSSVSSPVGGTVALNLPIAISTSSEDESRIGGAVSSYNGVTSVNYSIIGGSGSSSIDIYVSAATIAAGHSFSVSFQYCAAG